jgi:hypothetical protein
MGLLRRKEKSLRTSPVPPPGPGAAPAVFPRLAVVQDALRELYRALSPARIRSYSAAIAPVVVSWSEPVLDAQRLARAIALHLGMTDVRLIVAFRELGETGDGGYHAGNVELGPGPEYFITLSPRFHDDVRGTAAVLAHEVMHVFLHRNRIWWADQHRNEILTDTATVYLGTGWLMLDAHRVAGAGQSLGYLAPAELGYVLAKRAFAFGEDIEGYLAANPAARQAYLAGRHRAAQDHDAAPLSGCHPAAHRQYRADRRRAANLTAGPAADLTASHTADLTASHAADLTVGHAASHAHTGSAPRFPGGYRFEGHGPMKVVFGCPTCHQRIRVPVDRTATVRCATCRTTHAVTT